MKKLAKEFVFNDVALNWVSGDEVNLTRLWEMASSKENKKPTFWLQSSDNVEFILQVLVEQFPELKLSASKLLESRPRASSSDKKLRDWIKSVQAFLQNSGLVKVKRGKGGKTIAHWKLALDYAGYLSPELKSTFYDWVRDRIEEEANPDLAADRGIERAKKGWKRQGKSEQWIQQRLEGKVVRHKFTDTLKQHGVKEPHEYAQCTDAINTKVLGSPAKQLKAQRNLPVSKSLRDGVSFIELKALELAEALAEEKIEQENRQGVNECKDACNDAGDRVSRIFE